MRIDADTEKLDDLKPIKAHVDENIAHIQRGRSVRPRARSWVRKQKHHARDTEDDAADDDHPVTRSDPGNAKEEGRDKEEQPAEPMGA